MLEKIEPKKLLSKKYLTYIALLYFTVILEVYS